MRLEQGHLRRSWQGATDGHARRAPALAPHAQRVKHCRISAAPFPPSLSLSLSLSLSIALDPSVPLRPPPHQIATGHARRTLESRHQNIHMDQSIITPQLQAIEKQTSNEQSTKTYRHIDNVKQTNRQTDKRNRLHLFFSLSLPFVVPAFHLLYLKKTLQCNNLCEHNNLPHNV